jgi:hypothetical protein
MAYSLLNGFIKGCTGQRLDISEKGVLNNNIVVITIYVKWLAHYSENKYNDIQYVRNTFVRIPLLRGNPG